VPRRWTCRKCRALNVRTSSRKCAYCGQATKPKARVPEHARTLRVIHIDSTNLLPYQQDIYDAAGNVATKAYYSDYQYYENTPFPTNIHIERPQDHYSLTVVITKLTLNQKLDDDQFELSIPAGYPIQTMH